MFLEQRIMCKMAMKTKMQIEGAVPGFTLAIQKAAWKATPKDTVQHYSYEIPLELKMKLAKKRQLRKRRQET